MSTPIKLTIHNFCGIGHVEVRFDNKGVTRICGATGLGKSTIPDAVIWAQYGFTKNKTKGDDVINRFEKKGCYVELEYPEIKIVRYRKDKEFKNDVMVYTKVNGEWDNTAHTIKGDNKATQANIDLLLGMSFDVYVKVLTFGQGDEKSGKWGELTDKQLKQAMTEATGLEEIDVNKKKISMYKDEVKEALARSISSPIPLQGRLDTLTFKVNTIEADISRNKAEALRCNTANNDRIRYISSQVGQCEAEVAQLEALSVMSKVEFDAKVAEFEEYHVKLAQVKELLVSAQKEYMDANSESASVAAALRREQSFLDHLISDFKNIEAKIGTSCRECGKIYEERDLEDSSTIIESKIGDQRDIIEIIIDNSEEADSELTRTKTEVEFVQKVIRDLENLLGAYNKVVAEYNQGQAQKALITPTKGKLKSLEDELAHTLEYVAKEYDATQDMQRIEEFGVEINSVQAELDGVLLNIEKKETLIRALDDVIETLETSKGLIIDSVTVPLNENIQRCVKQIMPDMDVEFQTMTKLKNGEFREKFCIKAILGEGAKGYKSFSGGQRAVCDLCISLGFAMTIRDQQANLPSLMFVDEGFNAMDVDLATKAIQVLLDMDIKNLYVMSHESGLQELIPQTIELARVAGKTFIKE